MEENEEPIVCSACANEIDDSSPELMTDNGDRICANCLVMCARCDYAGADNDSGWYSVSDDTWCQTCWENHSFYCDRCSETYSDGIDNYSVSGETWCNWCVENRATWCDSCDEYYSGDECDNGCEPDDDEDSIGSVHEYRYKPNPVFHGSGNFYLGFELEMELNHVDREGYRKAVSSVIPLEIDNICYLKADGSISGQGFELVTHPHTLERYANASALFDYIENLRANYNARSWDTDSCGLHVHVSRTAFRSGAHTHRFLSLVYKNPREMMKLAGRKNSRFARFDDVYKRDDWGLPQYSLRDKIHAGSMTERYSAVNTNNDYTLELRFFRGNMKREGIMSALELSHASVEYTRDLTLSDVKLGALTWEWFADWVRVNNGTYPNLFERMSKVSLVNLDNRPLLNA